MNAPSTVAAPTRPLEKLLLQIERPPAGALYRIAIGFLLVPVFDRLLGTGGTSARFILYFIGVLLLLRLVPLVLRKLLPFSRELHAMWFSRRNAAKEYDSFQWRKMLWIGLGMAAYATSHHDVRSTPIIVAGVCILGGAAGHWIWRGLPASKTVY